MADNEISVAITADARGAKAGLGEAQKAVQGLDPMLQQMNAQFSAISDSTVQSTDRMNDALRSVSTATGDASTGAAGLAQQTLEVGRQFADGALPMDIFTGHAAQVLTAVSALTGETEGFIGFMGGPWGAVVVGAVGLLGALISKLSGSADQTSNLGDRQVSLARYLDSVTGKVKEQVSWLDMLAKSKDLTAQTPKLLSAYHDARVQLVDTLSTLNKVEHITGPKMPEDAKTAITNALRQYQSGLIRVVDLYAQIDAAAARHPGNAQLKDLANTALDLGMKTQHTAAAFQDNNLEVARLAVASGRATAEQRAQVAQATIANSVTGQSTQALNQLAAAMSRVAKMRVQLNDVKASGAKRVSKSNEAFPAVDGAADKPLPLSKPLDNLLQSATKTYAAIGKEGDKVATEQQNSWKNMANSISSSFATSLQGMIKGTQNFRGMMLNIGNAILGDATKWIQKKVSDFLTGELAQTAATTAGVTTRTGIEATGAATSKGISAASSLTQIGHSAAVAAAGAYAAIAKIPIVGPVLAPIAAAAALAGVIALGKSIFSAEGGMGQVPYDGAMFELHKDEMVLPASLATPMRSMLLNPAANTNVIGSANDGAVTHNHYYDIKAMDGQDVHRVLMRHHTSVARAANKAYRYGYKPA